MKKIGIVTIVGDNNYGNKLQNYAVEKFLKKITDYQVETIRNIAPLNNEKRNFTDYLKAIKWILKYRVLEKFTKRYQYFNNFNKYINYNKYYFTFSRRKQEKFYYDYLIIGSDQVWNPNYRFKDFDLGMFGNKNSKKISFAASMSVEKWPSNIDKKKLLNSLENFTGISVREEKAKELLQELGLKKNVEVLIDPTMLLTAKEWDEVSEKPKQLKCSKYILNYFLGELSESRKKEIDRIAQENDCEVINILDKKSPFYNTGPSEFLYLEKNAFLICTDSFHSSVFAILYNRPFIIFDRERKNVTNMNSRFDTLLSKFKIKNRKFNGKITKENLNHDYTEAYKILETERQKSMNFLQELFKIK